MCAEFDHPYSAAVMECLQRELARILRPAGMQLQWRVIQTPDAVPDETAIVVIAFQGVCRMSDCPPALPGPGPLGWTRIRNGQWLPMAGVDCNRVRRFISRLLCGYPQGIRDCGLGRALARIVAHELYHVFVRSEHHARGGVLNHDFTPVELVLSDLRFTPGEVLALKTRLNPPAPAGAP